MTLVSEEIWVMVMVMEVEKVVDEVTDMEVDKVTDMILAIGDTYRDYVRSG